VSRREEIFAVAADIFWDKGYHATSMNNIADASGLRKASLYHHITSKEALLYEMSLSSMHHIIDAVAAATSHDPEERLREVIARHVEALLSDRSRHATMLLELRSLSDLQRQHVVDLRSRYDNMIDESIRAVQAATGRWPDVSTRHVRLSLLGMLNWTVFWFSSKGAETPRDIAESFARVFMPTRA
jgi:AcrR family transcriptional regulator